MQSAAVTPWSCVQESERVLALRIVGELVALLDRQAERGGERLERLDAAPVRAREQPLDRDVRRGRRQRLGLAAAALVERPRSVVALPVLRAVPPSRGARAGTASGARRDEREQALAVALAR